MTKTRKEKVIETINRLGSNHPLVIHLITLAEDTRIADKVFDDVYRFLSEKK